MAEVGGKCESDEAAKINKHVSIHQQMTDAGQFSCAALCALSLRKLFEEEWNREFNKEMLTLILNGLEQTKQVREAIHAMYSGVGQDDMHPFVDIILREKVLQGDASPIVSELINIAVSKGNYDARTRALIKHVAWRLHIGWDHVEEMECQLAETIISQKYEMSEEEKAEQEKKAKHRKYKRAAWIGLATVTGGTLIGLTGGLAAPLVAAGAGAIIGGAGAAALGSAAGVAIIGSLFGVAGAGLTGYKMKKRVGATEEFEFEPLISGGPLQLQTIRQQLHITIAITGWIDSKMPDFKQPWKNLAESQEQYTLRWESRYLKDLGQALDYIFNSAVSIATHEALKYTVLSTLLAAITWPAALLSVSQVIDNPWSVALQRAMAAGRQLAEVLLSREQGKRPVTLIGYSLGGRVIFYCLEEMAKRKGCEGIVEDVVILGAPVTSDPRVWTAFQRVVAGRIINGYCRGDWLLKFLYRTASIQLRIAGLAPVKWTNHRMHNIDLSDVVSGHLDYMKQLDTILRVVGIRVRQEVQVTQGSALKPSGFLTKAGQSKETSPDESSYVFLTPDSDFPSEQEDSEDLLTNKAESDGKVLGGENLASSSEGTDHTSSAIKAEPASADCLKSASNASQSVNSELKDHSSTKSESSSPEEKNASSREQHREDSNVTSCETDHHDKTVTSPENETCEVGTSQSGDGNHHDSDLTNIRSSIPNASGSEEGQKGNTVEKTDKDNEDESTKKESKAAKDAAAEMEKVRLEKRKETEENKKQLDEKPTGSSGPVTAAEEVEVELHEAEHPCLRDSEEDSYTSSNPDSSPERETSQSFNSV